MASLTWMADVLRAAGLPVREIPGWQTRGHGTMGELLGVLTHHTAGPATGNYPSENVVVNGRPGLDGPLANLGLARDGTWIVIAAGQAWHAGTGSVSWCPRDQGNAHLIGVEAESVGTRDDWTAQQRESYPRGCAALLMFMKLGSWRVIAHKEWAPTRKIDPAFWDMNSFRADVVRWMDNPNPMTQEDPLMALSDADQALLVEGARSVLFGKPGVRNAGDLALTVYQQGEQITAQSAQLAAIGAKLDQLLGRPPVTLDPAAVSAGVTAALGDGLVISGTAKPAAPTTPGS